jgi:branched-chain amino acid aminotransferase
MQAIANVNGILSPLAEAKVSLLDRGFLYGDSIYEVTRSYFGVPFYLSEHFDRLENSARLAKMKLSQNRDFLTAEIKRAVLASAPARGEDVFVRYTVTRGEGALDIDPSAATKTSYMILVKELPNWKSEFFTKGMVLAIPTILRNSPLALDPNIKSGNYLNNILAVAEAKELGAHDALMLSSDGKLTEASNSNVSFVIGGEIVSPLHEPSTHTGNLKGITRALIAKIAHNAGLNYSERAMYPADIAKAEECFVSSATREVMPVCALIHSNTRKEFPQGGGPVVKKLQQEYKKYVIAYSEKRKSEAWF